MKKYTCIFIVALLAAAVSCSRDTEFEAEGTATGYELLLQASVDGMAAKAEVADVHDLQEDVLKTLDVYFYGTFSGDATPSVRTYHLNADDHFDAVSGKWKVASDWRTEHFVNGNAYTVYVAANSSKVKMSDYGSAAVATETLASQTITTLEALGNAIEFDYDPHAANGQGGTKPYWGANNDDGINPAWLGVHRKYTSTENITAVDSKADRYFTHEKTFLMNGTSASITPTAATGELVAPVTLSRAASKISVQVSFEPAFLTKLAAEKQWTLCGEPHWRFFNFAFSAPVFGDLSLPSTYDPTVSWFTSGADMIGYDGIDGNDLKFSSGTDKSFGFSTYSYPLTWTAATEGKHAPAIIVSVGYRDDSDTSVPEANRPVSYQAYKIPVVNPELALYSLDRNKIYTINATISSEGSTLVTDAYATQATYSIMPWTADAVASAISERDNSYVDVIPDAIPATTNVTDVILRGNGEQTFRLHVLKPDTKSFSIAYYGISGATQSDPFAQTGTPTSYPLTGNYTDEIGNDYTGCAATGAAIPYYINLDGNIRNTIGGSAIQNCFVKDGDDLLIISTALPNKGVKYMKIRVYLEGHADKYMDVNIRHYPTDALMAKVGHWASRQSAALVAGKITESERIGGPEELFTTMKSIKAAGSEKTYDQATYDSWNGYKFWVWEKCNETDEGIKKIEPGYEISQTRYKNHTSDGTVYGTPEEGYEKHIDPDDYPLYFITNTGTRNGVGVGNNSSSTFISRGSAISEDSAFATTIAEAHSYYYWGTGSTTRVSDETTVAKALLRGNTINDGNVDFLMQGSVSGTTHFYGYVFEKRHRVYYTGYQCFRKVFYHVKSSFVNWPNWAVDYGTSKSFTVGMYKLGTTFYSYPARIVDGNQWYRFEGGTGSSYALNNSNRGAIEVKNRLMYIMQLSEPSADYTVGRPLLNESSMSEDDVVAPAFMIASQLGFLNSDMISDKLTDGSPDITQAPYAKYWAAAHCASYLEVDTDGKYYCNDWRLPTRREIEVMIQYQGDGTSATLVSGFPVSGDDRVMKPVLEAGYYFALNGDLIDNTAYSGGSNHQVTVRCVRDLTPEEVEALNN